MWKLSKLLSCLFNVCFSGQARFVLLAFLHFGCRFVTALEKILNLTIKNGD